MLGGGSVRFGEVGKFAKFAKSVSYSTPWLANAFGNLIRHAHFGALDIAAGRPIAGRRIVEYGRVIGRGVVGRLVSFGSVPLLTSQSRRNSGMRNTHFPGNLPLAVALLCQLADAGVAGRDGQVYANSRDVAAFFGKRHDNVVRDIEEIASNLRPSQPAWFVEATRHDAMNRPKKTYDMTRDGFTLLVMGYTGPHARAEHPFGESGQLAEFPRPPRARAAGDGVYVLSGKRC